MALLIITIVAILGYILIFNDFSNKVAFSVVVNSCIYELNTDGRFYKIVGNHKIRLTSCPEMYFKTCTVQTSDFTLYVTIDRFHKLIYYISSDKWRYDNVVKLKDKK